MWIEIIKKPFSIAYRQLEEGGWFRSKYFLKIYGSAAQTITKKNPFME